MQLESKFQSKIIKQYESKGYYVVKLIQTNKNGIPDLLCISDSETLFIECKAKTGKLSSLQEYRHREMISKGIKVITLYAEK